MAVPPTSPLRVFPQAVNIDVQGFMPQGDLFQKTMASFEQGSKLPLLQEQIKHEKKRIKMENAKLDFAMSEAGRRQQEEERERAKTLANIDLLMKKAELFKAQAEASGAQFVDRGDGTAANGDVSPLGDSDLTDTASTVTTDKPPLKGENIFGEGFGTRMIKTPESPETPEAEQPAENFTYVPSFTGVRGVDDIRIIPLPGPLGLRDSTEYVRQQVLKQLNLEYPPYRGPRSGEAEYNRKRNLRAIELEDKFRPSDTSFALTDDSGLPITVPVVKVGNDVVDILGKPRIDLDRLPDAQKAADAEFRKAALSKESLAAQVTRDSNVRDLMQAAEYTVAAGKNFNPLDSRIFSFLPESVRNLANSDREKARNLARKVIQQKLRETLGAQFAFKEGEQMLNRAFNLFFDDEVNLDLMRGAAQEILTVTREFDRAQNYYKANNTLAGFSFNSELIKDHPVLASFDKAMAQVSSSGKSAPAYDPSKNAREKTLERLRARGPLGTGS